MFPYVKHAKSCKVTVIVISGKNGHKDIELQFNETENGPVFEDLFFGGYSYELFDCTEDILPDEVIRDIHSILQGQVTVIEAYDLKSCRRIADSIFVRSDHSDPLFGEPGYQKAMEKIHKPLSFFKKIFHVKEQYEIYDYENYQCVIKE